MKKNFHRVAAIVLALMMVMLLATAAFAEEEATVDTAKLEELLHIANSAKKTNYTSESWQALEDAMAQANAALDGGDQAAVDAAKSALALALSKVTSMDYSAVEEALAKVDQFAEEEELGEYWKKLQDAIDEAKALYGSGDQEGVNRAAEKINLRLEELRTFMESQQEETETPVVWIVLFCVSMAANIALAVVLVLKLRTNQNHKDDMPLVEYDIDDDVT